MSGKQRGVEAATGKGSKEIKDPRRPRAAAPAAVKGRPPAQ